MAYSKDERFNGHEVNGHAADAHEHQENYSGRIKGERRSLQDMRGKLTLWPRRDALHHRLERQYHQLRNDVKLRGEEEKPDHLCVTPADEMAPEMVHDYAPRAIPAPLANQLTSTQVEQMRRIASRANADNWCTTVEAEVTDGVKRR